MQLNSADKLQHLLKTGRKLQTCTACKGSLAEQSTEDWPDSIQVRARAMKYEEWRQDRAGHMSHTIKAWQTGLMR